MSDTNDEPVEEDDYIHQQDRSISSLEGQRHDLRKKIKSLTKERDELQEALTFVKTGPLASMLSAASEAPIGPDAMVAIPVDLIRDWDEVVSEALATVSDIGE